MNYQQYRIAYGSDDVRVRESDDWRRIDYHPVKVSTDCLERFFQIRRAQQLGRIGRQATRGQEEQTVVLGA